MGSNTKPDDFTNRTTSQEAPGTSGTRRNVGTPRGSDSEDFMRIEDQQQEMERDRYRGDFDDSLSQNESGSVNVASNIENDWSNYNYPDMRGSGFDARDLQKPAFRRTNTDKSLEGSFTTSNTRLADGSTYTGEMCHGQLHGRGVWLSATRESHYKGEFFQNKQHGYGVYTWDNHCTYEGQYVWGLKDGQGSCTWNDGRYYEGEWIQGKRSGIGTYRGSDNGEAWSGVWIDDRPIARYE